LSLQTQIERSGERSRRLKRWDVKGVRGLKKVSDFSPETFGHLKNSLYFCSPNQRDLEREAK
ncbi:hypothetical protein, partial [Chryseobacterium sp.]|uniref:hypothetical protein n=1 Tax=Chryseobacterium sp. TaxID=1871047 RepID=UPI001E5D3482